MEHVTCLADSIHRIAEEIRKCINIKRKKNVFKMSISSIEIE